MERFFDYFTPEHYDLDLAINDEKTKINGTATIKGEAKNETIKLHAVRMDIKSVHLDGAKFEDFIYESNILTLHHLASGEHELKIKFISHIETNMEGAYRSTYEYEGETQKIVVTQFESHYARECFPCVDEPIAKATFALKISSVADDTILSNMPATFTTTQEGRKTVEFAETPRMSTYLVAFAAGKFISTGATSAHGIKINVYAGLHQDTADLTYAAQFAADVLDFYDDRFKTPFPLPKMDLLALPDFEAGAMENWGLVTFREIALLANENSSLDTKQYVAIVIAHELSHMWFGDLVTMKWWDDLWLNESFANMMEVYSTDEIRPELRAWEDFYLTAVSGSLSRDSLPGVQPVKVDVASVEDIANLFDSAIVYGKGAHLLLMLMRTMGEEKFFAGLTDYFAKHQYGNTSADDLWDALTPHADFDVKEFMTPWLTQSGYPVISGKNQTRFLLTGETDDTKYPIRELRDDLSGHYIINYSDEEFAEKLKHIDAMSKEQKLRLLMDRRLLAKTDMVEGASMLPLIQAFANETDSVIWELVSAIVADLKQFFNPKTEEKRQFQTLIGNLARPNYERLGVVAKDSDTYDDIQLRSTIMGMMLYSNDKQYRADVKSAYGNKHIKDVDANLRWIIGSTLIRDDASLDTEYYNIYNSTSDAALKRDLMDAVTNTRDHDILAGYLDKLKDENIIRPQDRLIFYIRLLRNYVIKDEAFAWMYDNWDWLRKAEGDKTISEYPRYSASFVRSSDEAEKYKEFFNKYINENILARDINIAFTEIDTRLHLISHNQAAIFDYLRRNFN